jgi:hypothetical protein
MELCVPTCVFECAADWVGYNCGMYFQTACICDDVSAFNDGLNANYCLGLNCTPSEISRECLFHTPGAVGAGHWLGSCVPIPSRLTTHSDSQGPIMH